MPGCEGKVDYGVVVVHAVNAYQYLDVLSSTKLSFLQRVVT